MAKFYIEKLVVNGNGKEPSVIEFCEGVNFIIGPSNTGKSYIVECIDYLFGFDPSKNKPFRFDPSLGYDRITLFIRTPNGSVILERGLGEKKIYLFGNDPNFENGTYSLGHTAKYNISSVWLQLMGVEEIHKIMCTETGKTQNLTWRSILHMFFIKQGVVSRTQSVLYNPELFPNMTSTPSKAAALFLMSGKDADEYEVVEDKKIRTAKRAAVIEYIRDTVDRYSKRENEVLEKAMRFEDTAHIFNYQMDNIHTEIDVINSEIEDVQNLINRNIEQSRQLMSDIYTYNGKRSECEIIADRFMVLRSQYQSDIERLTFAVDGNLAHSLLPKREICPFCDSEIAAAENTSYSEAAHVELQHIRIHLAELNKAEQDVASEHVVIESTIANLEKGKRQIDEGISVELTPKLNALREKLKFYRHIVEINKELEIVREEERNFNAELFEIETEEEPTEVKYDINQFFDIETVRAFQEKVISILQACHYESAGSARLNMETFDLEVGGRHKAISNGGGYCGFLNTVLALAFVEFLEEQGEYSPGLLIVDSPVSQLSESDYKERSDMLKSGLLRYLISNSDDSAAHLTLSEQIIIVEHKERLPMLEKALKNSNNVKVIEFTQDKQHGRYGFLHGVY